jgi:hypothetical protein
MVPAETGHRGILVSSAFDLNLAQQERVYPKPRIASMRKPMRTIVPSA